MPTSKEVIGQYLQSAIAAERKFEENLRSFAQVGDDQDVQLAFAEHADETRSQLDRLVDRLGALGLAAAGSDTPLASLPQFAPDFAGAGDAPEVRLVQNLITAYCVETGECAMYEALASVASAAGDSETEQLARTIQSEEVRAAEKVFHFLRSRSKIAFNVLTPQEIDPAVETKVGMA